jgi:hypothetical protein
MRSATKRKSRTSPEYKTLPISLIAKLIFIRAKNKTGSSQDRSNQDQGSYTLRHLLPGEAMFCTVIPSRGMALCMQDALRRRARGLRFNQIDRKFAVTIARGK